MPHTGVEKRPFLAENKVVVESRILRDQLQEKGFGERFGKKLVLDLYEALYLLEKRKFEIQDLRKRAVGEEQLLRAAKRLNRRFYSNFVVYRDIREKGYVIKTGFKFGFPFRVYPKGKKPGEEHTQWVILVCTQEERFSMPELSRMVRLASNLNTVLVQAVVDSENDINYFAIERLVP